MRTKGESRGSFVLFFIAAITFLGLVALAGTVLSQPAVAAPESGAPLFLPPASFLPQHQPPAPSTAPARNGDAGAQAPDIDLRITLVGPTKVEICDRVTYTVFITNNDTITATSVLITDTMPAGFTPTSWTATVASLAPGQSTSRSFGYNATCTAPSGQNQVTITDAQNDLFVRRLDFDVLPGAITLRKEPAVIKAGLGDIVTWTVYIENTGYGRVSNVVVTDALGSGLQFVAGTTSTSYASLAPGQVYTFSLSARVVSCANLENEAWAHWGCNGSPCQTQYAKAAVDLRLDAPSLDYTLPAINISYCAGSGTFQIPVVNSGDGTAYTPTLSVNLSPLVLTASSAPYSGGAFHLPDIPKGSTYVLTFTLSLPTPPCGVSGGPLLFTAQYYNFPDGCASPFTFPTKSGSWSVTGATPSLQVTKTGPSEVYAEDRITYTLSVVSANLTSMVYITDVFQAGCGYQLLDAGGGTVVAANGRYTITWTTSTSPWSRTVVFGPGASCPEVCSCCGQTVVNTLGASGSDCQGCNVNGTSTTTTYVQCERGTTSAKAVSPAAAEACTTRYFTNTFQFASSYITVPAWSRMSFTEALSSLVYVGGSAAINISNGATSCPATFSVASTNPLVLNNISPTCAVTVPGATMVVTYRATVVDTGCAGRNVYDWSYLNVGAGGTFWCAACDTGVTAEGVFFDVTAPTVGVAISGVPAVVVDCAPYTPTITLTRGATPAYDVRMRVAVNSFSPLGPPAFGGVTPVMVISDGLGFDVYYGDAFATATTATMWFPTQRRCDTQGQLTATVYFDNLCSNDENYDDRCSSSTSTSATAWDWTPLLYKFPEVIYAAGDTVTWTLTAINSGAGAVHGITLVDELGSGLAYLSSQVLSTHGSAQGVVPITSSNVITWPDLAIESGERYTITLVAEILSCNNLTNTLRGFQNCLGHTCDVLPVKHSHVELPVTALLNTTIMRSPVQTCATRTVTATVRNAGLMSVYSAAVTETLATGLAYQTGTTEYAIGEGTTPPVSGWIAGSDPSGAPNGPLVWTSSQIAALARLYPHQTVWIRYSVYVNCDFAGGHLVVDASYVDRCGNLLPTAESRYTLVADPPRVTISKNPAMIYAEPGDAVNWVLSVANSSQTPAYQTLVTDTLPANVTYVAASPAPSFQSGQVIAWNVGTLTNSSWTAYITATVNSGACTAVDTTNWMTTTWGCPETTCKQIYTAHSTLRTRPVIDPPGLTTDVPPAQLHQCGGVLTVTLTNNGPPAYNVWLTDTLPSGYAYAETVSASTAANIYPSAGDTAPVWRWTSTPLPTGVTTVVLRVVNPTTSGGCSVPAGGPNVINVLYDDSGTCAGTGSYTATASQNVTVASPTLVATKSPLTQVASAGQVVAWTVRITNTSGIYAPNVVVTDLLGSGLVSPQAGPGNYPGGSNTPGISGNVITWSPPFTLAAHSTWQAVVTATVSATGMQTDSVYATGSCAVGCIYATTGYTAYVTLNRSFDKGPPLQTDTIGAIVVFTFTSTLEDHDGTYNSLTLTDTLPTGLGYLASTIRYSSDVDGNVNGPYYVESNTPTSSPAFLGTGNIVWALGNLPGSVQIDGVITATILNIPSNVSGVSRVNTLRMSYVDDGQTYTFVDTAQVNIVEPFLERRKAVVSSTGSTTNLDGNALLNYTVYLTNTGTSTAYDVVVTDTMPTGLAIQSIGQGGQSWTVGNTTWITWWLTSIPLTPPAPVTALTYTARLLNAPAGITITNYVTAVYSSLPDGNPYPGQERPYTTTAQADVVPRSLVTAKAVAPASASGALTAKLRIGDLVTYTLTTSVPPNLVAYWPWQWDNMQAGLHYVPGTFQIGGSLPGTLDTVAAHYTNVPYSVIQGNNAGGSNPNVGTYKTTTANEAIEWWMNTFTNTTAVTQTVVVTFTAQFTGRSRTGAEVAVVAGGTARSNSQTVNWDIQDNGAFTVTDSFSQTATVNSYFGRPTLAITKTSSPPDGSIVGAGTPINYFLVVANSTQTPAYDIVISDVLPSGVVYQGYALASSPGSGSPAILSAPTPGATGVITWLVSPLNGTIVAPTVSKAFTLTVSTVVSPSISAGVVLTNTAVVPYYDSQPGLGPQFGFTQTERSFADGQGSVVHYTPSDVHIVKAVSPITATIGQQLYYTVTVPSPAITATMYTVLVTDVVDARFTVNGASAHGGVGPAAAVNGQTVSASWTSILSSTQGYVVITATVRNLITNTAGTVVPDTARFTWQNEYGQTYGPRDSNTVNVTIVEPDIGILKSATAPLGLKPGDIVTYTFNFSNAAGVNNSVAYDVTLLDTLPPGLTYGGVLPGTPAPASVVGSGPTLISWFVSQMDPGVSYSYQFTATVNAGIAPGSVLTNSVMAWTSTLPGTVPGERDGGNSPNNPRYVEYSNVPLQVAGSLGNYVWYDSNYNGIQDNGEPPVPGVTVTLYSGTGTPLATDVTDGSGLYLFEYLPPGDYYVVFTLPPGYSFTLPDQGANDALDSDANPATGQTATTHLDLGENDMTWDAGILRLDWGDLPDPTFPTLAASNGPRHVIQPGVYLGASVDSEANGQPNATATGDDSNGVPDDEDGVIFATPLVPGRSATITVTASTAGYLNAWIDFNGNGTFDPGEQIALDTPLAAGPNAITFAVPANATGVEYSRFRFTTGQNQATLPTGLALNGEVEDYVLAALGDYVWLDGNGDGLQTSGEPGVNGVVVSLLDASGNPVRDALGNAITTTTHNHPVSGNPGWYEFPGLPAGSYSVSFAPPAGYEFTTPNVGGDDTIDSDYVPANGRTQTVTLGPGQTNPTLDAGLVVFDWGDLPDGPYPTLAANNGANHQIITGLYLGSSVDAEPDGQPNLTATGDDINGVPDDEDCVVFNTPLVAGRPATITVTASQAGYLNAWIDWNNNGVLEAGEKIASDLLLAAGPNQLVVNVPATAVDTPYDYARFRFTSGQGQATAPTGRAPNGEVEDYVLGVIGDYVWLDANGNGQQDDGPTNGLNGVQVRLLDASGNPVLDAAGHAITTTTTNHPTTGNPGWYQFAGLPAGDYRIGFVAPAGLGFTAANIGSDATDSDANPTTGLTGVYTIGPHTADLSVDAGLVQYDWGDLPDPTFPTLAASNGPHHQIVSGVYLGAGVDGEGNGQPNATATGDDINGVPDDEDGVIFATPLVPGRSATITVTASTAGYLNAWIDFNGNGTFDPGEQIALDTPLAAGPNAITFVVPANATGVQYSRFRFTTGQNQATLPTGLAPNGEVEDYALASLGDYVWFDRNGDGIQNELPADGMNGIVVSLLNASGNPVRDASGNPITTTTHNHPVSGNPGWYEFPGLPAGTYSVGFEPPVGFGFTSQDQGLDDTLDSDANVYTGHTGTVTLGPAEVNDTLDAGLIQSDWGDLPDGPYPTTFASNGPRHTIVPGLYLGNSVDFEPDGQPNSNANGDDLNGVPDDEDGITFLTPIMPNSTATIQVVASQAGYLNAWIDFNGNGIFDAGDKIFSDQPLTAGVNTLTFPTPSFVTATVYSRFRYTSGPRQATEPTGQAPNGEVEDYVLLALGNRVWRDDGVGTTDNGRQDGGEAGIPNVRVELRHADGSLVLDGSGNPVYTTTDANGDYLFTGLAPGSYVVHIAASNWATPTAPLYGLRSSTGAGSPDADLDQDVDENGIDDPNPAANGISSGPVTLTIGGEPTSEDGNANTNLTIDFGFYPPGAIGDTVWLDYDGNGVQGPGEPGLPGVVITMVDQFGHTYTTTTDANGVYTFTNLALDTYYTTTLQLASLPPGTWLTTPGHFSSLLTSANPTNEDHDYGVRGLGEVGDRVWYDPNADGIQDPLELGLPGVVVTLTSSSGLVVTTTTGTNGMYLFPHLLLSTTYTVTVQPIGGYYLTTPGQFTTDLTVDQPTNYTLDFGFDSPIDPLKMRPHGDVCATWTFWYYIFVTNTSSSAINNVVLTDTLPAGIAPYSVQTGIGYPYTYVPGGTFDGVNQVVWHLGSLGPGNSLAVWIRAQTYGWAAGHCLTNYAWLGADEIEIPIPMSDVACVRACQTNPPTPVPPPPPTPTPTPTATPTPLPGLTTLVIQQGSSGQSEDTYLYRYAPQANYALSPLLKAGYKQTNVSLLRFTLPALPAGATVHQASLQLYAAGWGGADMELGVYAITRTVTISEATWTNARTGFPWGAGGLGDVSTDRRPAPEDRLTTAGPTRWYGWDVTNLVKQWYAGMPAEGVLLRGGTSTASFFFASAEAEQVSKRPRLVIQYWLPGGSPVIVRDEPIPLPRDDRPMPTATPVVPPKELLERLEADAPPTE
ncbi:MAG: Serine-aspartate repeat-containing protein D precursor [Chloroflexi bacterium ADurb.Bin180]|nr:MAG: Serine-aspartate repeat-containing protein D precursor [Chloroflexi bacterium ADurb.Bin180]